MVHLGDGSAEVDYHLPVSLLDGVYCKKCMRKDFI